METELCLATIAHQFAAFLTVLEAGTLEAKVPSCPDWDLRRLALHLAETYEWVRTALGGTGEPDDPAGPDLADADVPSYVAEAGGALMAALRSCDPREPCWTMAPPANAGFWLRRMVHETTIHRWDAQRAIGRPDRIPAEVAHDGVREVGEMVLPRQVRLGRIEPLPYQLQFRLSDVGDELTLGRDGIVANAQPDAWVTGTAENVLLMLWKRIHPSDWRLRLGGDSAALRAVLSVALTP